MLVPAACRHLLRRPLPVSLSCSAPRVVRTCVPWPPNPGFAADLLESKYFQQEVSLPHRLFLLWMVGLAARCKY